MPRQYLILFVAAIPRSQVKRQRDTSRNFVMPTLFDPVQLGAISADNRILMAPLTRARADRDGVPQAFVKDYYAQRSGAGLIISEATGISRQGLGWPNAPGIWSEAQVEAWKPVTAAVHAAGSKIVSQLLRDDGTRFCAHLRRQEGLCRSARPHEGRDRGNRFRLCRRCPQRDPRRVRRHPAPRGERISDRPVPARQLQHPR